MLHFDTKKVREQRETMRKKRKEITVIDGGNIACNKVCAAIKEKGLPHQGIWLYLHHLVLNIEHEEDLTLEQRQTIKALFQEYLKTVYDQKSSKVVKQQGLHFLEDINQLRNSRLERKIREEQLFTEDLLLTISRYLGKIYDGLLSQQTTELIETFKHNTIGAIHEAPNKKKIIDLVTASFDQVNVAVENNIATIKDSVESMLNLESKALLDTLTGLFNRRFYDQELPKITEAFCKLKGEKPFSILAIDIDHFKQVNDTYGHFIGDAALQRVAEVIQKNCRAGIDSPIRNGGDEFILFLIGANRNVALRKAEKIIAEITQIPMKFTQQNSSNDTEEVSFHLTLSIGVCEMEYNWVNVPAKELVHSVHCPGEEMAVAQKLTLKIVEAADKALYEAKENGRNRACVYGKT